MNPREAPATAFALACLAAGLTLLAAAAAASGGAGDHGGATFATVTEALEEATPGEAVVVHAAPGASPAVIREQVNVTTSAVTLCAGEPLDASSPLGPTFAVHVAPDATHCSPPAGDHRPVLHAPEGRSPTLAVRADDVTVRGLAVHTLLTPADAGLATPGEGVLLPGQRPFTASREAEGQLGPQRAVVLDGNGSELRNVAVRVRSGPCTDDPACPTGTGVVVPPNRTGVTITGSLVAVPSPAAGGTLGGSTGVRLASPARVADSTLRNWTGAAIALVDEALDGTRILDNTFRGDARALRLAGDPGPDPAQGPPGFAARDNSFAAPRAVQAEAGLPPDAPTPGKAVTMVVGEETSGLLVDARGNDWGVYSCEAVRFQVQDRGIRNYVLYLPFRNPTGVRSSCQTSGLDVHPVFDFTPTLDDDGTRLVFRNGTLDLEITLYNSAGRTQPFPEDPRLVTLNLTAPPVNATDPGLQLELHPDEVVGPTARFEDLSARRLVPHGEPRREITLRLETFLPDQDPEHAASTLPEPAPRIAVEHYDRNTTRKPPRLTTSHLLGVAGGSATPVVASGDPVALSIDDGAPPKVNATASFRVSATLLDAAGRRATHSTAQVRLADDGCDSSVQRRTHAKAGAVAFEGVQLTEAEPACRLELEAPHRPRVEANRTQPVEVDPGPLHEVEFTAAPDRTDAVTAADFDAVPLDSEGNERADAVRFSVESGPGEIDADTGRYTSDEPGTAVVRATAAAQGKRVENKVNITVEPGPLAEIAFTGGPARTDAVTPANFSAVPLDAEGNPRDGTIRFSVENRTGTARLKRINATATKLVPDQNGTVVLHANASDPANATGLVWNNRTVHIDVGPLASVQVETPGGEEVGELTKTTDDDIAFVARGYDAKGNLRGPLDADWSLEPVTQDQDPPHKVGTFAPDPASETTLELSQVGEAVVEANAHGSSDETGVVDVDPGSLHHIQVEVPGEGEVGDRNVTADETLDLVARGYDADGNLRGSIQANWSLEPTDSQVDHEVGNLTPTIGNETTLPFDDVGEAKARAEAAGLSDATGTLRVSPGALHHLRIVDDDGDPVGPVETTTDATLPLAAQGLDADGNVNSTEVAVDWNLTPVDGDGRWVGTLSPENGTSATLDLFHPGATQVTAHRDDAENDTAPIDVAVGDLANVTFTQDPTSTPADTSVDLAAVARDADGNARDDDVSFALAGGPEAGNLTDPDGNRVTFHPEHTGNWTIIANASDDGQTFSAQHTIRVTDGALAGIAFTEARDVTEAGAGVDFDAQPRDANGNARPDEVRYALQAGSVGSIDNATGAFRSTETGTALVRATATSGTTTVSTTTEIDVEPAALHHLRLEGPDGATCGPTTATADANLTYTATGYDAHGNRIGLVAADWTISPAARGRFHPSNGSQVNLELRVTGSANLTATRGDLPADREAGPCPLEVTPGSVADVEIAASGPPVGERELTTDDVVDLAAVGYDADGNLVGPVSVDWTLAGDATGNLNRTEGPTVTLDLTTPGVSNVTADHRALADGPDDRTASFDVDAGAPDRLRVDGPDGAPLGVTDVTTDESLVLVAHGFDADGNDLGPVPANWSLEEGAALTDVGTFNRTRGARVVLNLSTTGRAHVDVDRPNLNDTHESDGGPLRVHPGAIASLTVTDRAGTPVGNLTLSTDQKVTLQARGYDADGNLVGPVPATWASTGSLEPVPDGPTTDVTFAPSVAGTAGNVTADNATLAGSPDDATGRIDVTDGSLARVVVRRNGSEAGDIDATTDDTLSFVARGFDADGNALGQVPVTWTLLGDPVATPDPTSGPSTELDLTTPGEATLQATSSQGPSDTTGTIGVAAGDLASLTLVRPDGSPFQGATLSADENLTLEARGRDADGNALGPVAVNWTSAGGIDPVDAHGTTVTFRPTEAPAEGRLVATHGPSSASARSALVTVEPGPLDDVVFRDIPQVLQVGNATALEAVAVDAEDNPRPDPVTYSLVAGPGTVDADTGELRASEPGTARVRATAQADGAAATTTLEVPVELPGLVELEVVGGRRSQTAGSTSPITYQAQGVTPGGTLVPLAETHVTWTVEEGGGTFEGNVLTPTDEAGVYRVTARYNRDTDVTDTVRFQVSPGPVASIDLAPASLRLAAGGEASLSARAADAAGNTVSANLTWSTDAPDVVDVDPATGTLQARGDGVANVTARHVPSGTAAAARVEVVPDPRRHSNLTVRPGDLDLRSGGEANLVPVAEAPDGSTVSGFPADYTVANASVAAVADTGLVRGRQAGTTTVTVEAAGETTQAVVAVEPGDPVRLEVHPSSATVSAGGSVDLDLRAWDAWNNPVAVTDATWSLQDDSPGSVDARTGVFQAGDEGGVATVRVQAGPLGGVANVHVDPPALETGETADVTAHRSADADGTGSVHSVGVASTSPDSSLQVETEPTRQEQGLESANVSFGERSDEVALTVEVRDGASAGLPSAVDPAALATLTEGAVGSPAHPGLYLTVAASSDGETLSAAELNRLVETADVRFRLDASYVRRHGFDPADLTLAEYSAGRQVNASLEAHLVSEQPREGAYVYTASLYRFSSFAALPPQEPDAADVDLAVRHPSPGTAAVEVEASEPVETVDWTVDGEPYRTTDAAPHGIRLETREVGGGAHTVTAHVDLADGGSATASRDVTVQEAEAAADGDGAPWLEAFGWTLVVAVTGGALGLVAWASRDEL